MFKVSLLPDSYRRRLESRKKIDLISKVALVILVCLFIVYGGVAVKGQILKSKLKTIQNKNTAIESEFPALQEYQNIYNELGTVRKMIESITPQDPEAVEFFTTILNQTPDYVQITQIDLENWFKQGICTLTCTVQDYQDYRDYVELFKTEEMQKFVKTVETTSITRTSGDDGKSVTFTLVLSMSNAVEVSTGAPVYETVTDKKGEAVTNDSGEVQTTQVTTTAAAESTTASETTTGEAK